jgi:hypothetical protein
VTRPGIEQNLPTLAKGKRHSAAWRTVMAHLNNEIVQGACVNSEKSGRRSTKTSWVEGEAMNLDATILIRK